jgi:hypothetical protein
MYCIQERRKALKSLSLTASQFFITYAKQSSLDGKYSIFGKYVYCPTDFWDLW